MMARNSTGAMKTSAGRGLCERVMVGPDQRTEPPRVSRRPFCLSLLCGATGHLKLGIVGGLSLGGRDVPDRLEKAAVVEPVDPFESGKLDGFEAAPGAAPMDHLGFVEAVDGFGEGIVVAVTDAANRRLDARRGKPLGIFDRDVLHPAVAVMDEAAAPDGPALVQG